jgi:metallo-beta-lactamase family protein
MKIQFFGAARTVTGSKHLITSSKGTKILLDCGFFQGIGKDTPEQNATFEFNPAEVDYLILSHAHIDHSGNIPNLVKQGFNGPIYCTPATKDLCYIMLEDSARIQESDLHFVNQRRKKRNEPLLKPLYTVADVKIAMNQFIAIPYNEEFQINDEISFQFKDAGHIIGSASVNLKFNENDKTRSLCFTGDIGRYNSAILRNPDPFPQADYIICESTYGDRLHSNQQLSEKQLFEIIQQTCVEQKGRIIIPAFSLGRTQELVYALDKMESAGILPHIKVYVDSPLSTNATNIMRKHSSCFNDSIKEYMKKDADPFGFNKLFYIREVEDSKRINSSKEPCIIISASGMATAGRIKHHLANNIEDAKNTVLIVGYAEPQSLGGRLRNGAKQVRIFGDELNVNAKVVVLDSYSAHADYEEMIQYLSCQHSKSVKKMFLVHGEYDRQVNFKEKLLDAGFRNIAIPSMNEAFDLG